MNQPVFLHIVERLEGFLGKLPDSIQKPVLHELTPLKELFLKQRAPRIVLTGSHKLPVQEVIAALFSAAQPGDLRNVLMELYRWQETSVGDRGNILLLDARGADADAIGKIEEELTDRVADVFLHVVDGNSVLPRDLETLAALVNFHRSVDVIPKIIGISLAGPKRSAIDHNGSGSHGEITAQEKLRTALVEKPELREHILQVMEVDLAGSGLSAEDSAAARLMSLLSQQLPNEARVEMIRISRDRESQTQIAQQLVKSTSAICTAVGAQPIPLADLPILTTLQLVMVSGIMYISGRERSLRAATEFVGALGVNVGAGMVLREGARAVLKFFPGWGNVVCGMVAGAGTYALGRAAIVYFLEGVTLNDARRIYLSNRKKKPQRQLAKRTTGSEEPSHRS